MGTIDISYYNLFVGLLLLAIPFFYLWKFKTGLLKPAVIGTLRMIIQLFFIGIYLKYLFLWNNPWINFLWVIVMIFVAGQTALVRTGLKRRILLIPITVGFLCSVILVGLYFIGIVATLRILLFQIILHQNYRWIKSATSNHLIVQLEDFEGLHLLQKQLKNEHVEILSIKVEKKSNKCLKTNLYLRLPKTYELASLMALLESNKKIKSIEY